MSGTLKAGVVIAMTMTGAAMSEQAPTTQGPDDARKAIAVSAQDAERPVVLQPVPDTALNCQVESERQFEPNRRAFVMKKVMVCR